MPAAANSTQSPKPVDSSRPTTSIPHTTVVPEATAVTEQARIGRVLERRARRELGDELDARRVVRAEVGHADSDGRLPVRGPAAPGRRSRSELDGARLLTTGGRGPDDQDEDRCGDDRTEAPRLRIMVPNGRRRRRAAPDRA